MEHPLAASSLLRTRGLKELPSGRRGRRAWRPKAGSWEAFSRRMREGAKSGKEPGESRERASRRAQGAKSSLRLTFAGLGKANGPRLPACPPPFFSRAELVLRWPEGFLFHGRHTRAFQPFTQALCTLPPCKYRPLIAPQPRAHTPVMLHPQEDKPRQGGFAGPGSGPRLSGQRCPDGGYLERGQEDKSLAPGGRGLWAPGTPCLSGTLLVQVSRSFWRESWRRQEEVSSDVTFSREVEWDRIKKRPPHQKVASGLCEVESEQTWGERELRDGRQRAQSPLSRNLAAKGNKARGQQREGEGGRANVCVCV